MEFRQLMTAFETACNRTQSKHMNIVHTSRHRILTYEMVTLEFVFTL